MIEVKIFGLAPYESSQEQVEVAAAKLRENGWEVVRKLADDRTNWTQERAEPFFTIPPANYKTENKPTYLVCSRGVRANGNPK